MSVCPIVSNREALKLKLWNYLGAVYAFKTISCAMGQFDPSISNYKHLRVGSFNSTFPVQCHRCVSVCFLIALSTHLLCYVSSADSFIPISKQCLFHLSSLILSLMVWVLPQWSFFRTSIIERLNNGIWKHLFTSRGTCHKTLLQRFSRRCEHAWSGVFGIALCGRVARELVKRKWGALIWGTAESKSPHNLHCSMCFLRI